MLSSTLDMGVTFSNFNSSCKSPHGIIFGIVFATSSFIISCDSREVYSSSFAIKSFNSYASSSILLSFSSSLLLLKVISSLYFKSYFFKFTSRIDGDFSCCPSKDNSTIFFLSFIFLATSSCILIPFTCRG